MSDSLILACPHCHRKNRLPRSRLADGGVCGHCKRSLFTGQPVELSDATFHAHATSDLPLVVDFWASWCGPCQQFAPVFSRAAGVLEPAARLAKVNTEQVPALAQRFAIRSIPTLLIMRQGKEVARLSGALTEAQFVQWVRQQTG